MVSNKALIFKKVPTGFPVAGQDLVIETSTFDPEQAAPKNGITLKLGYFSLDPYMRGRMRDPSIKSYSQPFTLGDPIDGGVIATVLKTDNSGFKVGDLVTGRLPLQEYITLEEKEMGRAHVLSNPYKLDWVHFLSALGMPGLTAYSSLYEIGKPKKGQTIFVSAASGAVGQIVGQLAKHEGLTVIGSVGSDDKLDFIKKELGFDGGFNYKKEKPSDALARLAPSGIDIYYENVGGEQLDAALDHMKDFGRVVVCGMISQYNATAEERWPIQNISYVLSKRLTMQGFIVSDENMGPKHVKARDENVAKWLSEGKFKAKYSVTDGIDNGAEALIGMLRGKNFGKAVLKVADLDLGSSS